MIGKRTIRAAAVGLALGVVSASTASAQVPVGARTDITPTATIDWNVQGISNPMTFFLGLLQVSVSSNGNPFHLVAGGGWSGGFTNGDGLYFNQGGNSTSFTFGSLITGFASQLWLDFPPGGTINVTEWRGGSAITSYSVGTGGGAAVNANQAQVFGYRDNAGFDRLDFNVSGNSNGNNEYAFNQVDIANGPVVTTPEPASMALLGTGFLGLAAWRRRRQATLES